MVLTNDVIETNRSKSVGQRSALSLMLGSGSSEQVGHARTLAAQQLTTPRIPALDGTFAVQYRNFGKRGALPAGLLQKLDHALGGFSEGGLVVEEPVGALVESDHLTR